MSKLKSLGRKLDPKRVEFAIQVHDKRKQLAHDMIKTRLETDKEFAADIIRAVGDNLPKDIREQAEKLLKS